MERDSNVKTSQQAHTHTTHTQHTIGTIIVTLTPLNILCCNMVSTTYHTQIRTCYVNDMNHDRSDYMQVVRVHVQVTITQPAYVLGT